MSQQVGATVTPAFLAGLVDGPGMPDDGVSSATALPVLPLEAPAENEWSAQIPDAACIPQDLPQTGRVVEVLDGETIRVLMDRDGRVYSVRYLGPGVPGDSRPSAELAQQALARNTELTYRRQAILVRDLSDTDSSGTLLRYVLIDGVFVNRALVREGWVQVGMQEPDTACLQSFLEAQQQAQREGVGRWSGSATSSPVP